MRVRRFFCMELFVLAAGILMAGIAMAEPASQYLRITDTNNINASSVLPEGQYDYWARNTQDGDLSTAWVEGASGDGIGEYIDLHYPAGTVITGMKICPGYCKNQDIFDKNSAPASITITAAGGSGTVDLSSVADSYSACAAGVEFGFSSPLILEDGNIRVTIASVRSGWKYQDTCISELYFKGYDGTAAGSDTDLGSSESAGQIQAPAQDELWEFSSLAYWVYRKHLNETLQDTTISVSDLSQNEDAFLLHYYQYNYTQEDTRVTNQGEYNTATITDLKEILNELIGNTDPTVMDLFISQYAVANDGTTLTMYGTGDFGDAGPFYFQEPEDTSLNGDVLTLTGHLSTGASYSTVYRANPPGSLINYRFESVTVSGTGN